MPRQRVPDEPVYEPTDYEWITWPTSKCDAEDCYNYFLTERKTCPMCGHPRRKS